MTECDVHTYLTPLLSLSRALSVIFSPSSQSVPHFRVCASKPDSLHLHLIKSHPVYCQAMLQPLSSSGNPSSEISNKIPALNIGDDLHFGKLNKGMSSDYVMV